MAKELPPASARSTALARTNQRGRLVKQSGGSNSTPGGRLDSNGGSRASVNVKAGGRPMPGNPGGYGTSPLPNKPNSVKVNIPTASAVSPTSPGIMQRLSGILSPAIGVGLRGVTAAQVADPNLAPRDRGIAAAGTIHPLLGTALSGMAFLDDKITELTGVSSFGENAGRGSGSSAFSKTQRVASPAVAAAVAPTATLSDTPPQSLVPEQEQPGRPPASGTKIKVDEKYYDTGYHAKEIAELRKKYPGGGNAAQSQSIDSEVPAYIPPTESPEPVEEVIRRNANGIEQRGKKLNSSDLSSLGITDASRFWESELAAGDAPAAGDPASITEATQGVKPVDRSTLPELSEEDKALTSPMYANAARNAARRAFLDAPAGQGVMGAINARNRAVGGDYENGFNVGGKHYQWADGVDQRQKSAAMYALSGGAGNTKEGFDEFAQNFLKDYVKNTPGVIGHTPESAVEFERPNSDHKPRGIEYKNVKYISPDPSQGFVAPDAGYQALTQQINF